MRLNLGCGDSPAAGWVNVDAWGGARADVLCDLGSLPFADGSFDMVYAGHVLEHVELTAVGMMLREVRRVLADGGTFCAVGPDCDRIDPVTQPDLYLLASSATDGGEGANPLAQHRWDCTESRLLDEVRAVFPSASAVLVADVPEPFPTFRAADWQCAVIA